MQDHVQEMLGPIDIDYNFRTNNYNPEIRVNINKRQQIYLIFKEAINNISKHSNATNVEIYIENRSRKFHLNIKDNGTSFENMKNKDGMGIKNMYLRAERIDAELDIDSANGFLITLKCRI